MSVLERQYVAGRELLWGDRRLKRGDPVPSDDPYRNYKVMLKMGDIIDVTGQVSMDELAVLTQRVAAMESLLGAIAGKLGVEVVARGPAAVKAEGVPGEQPLSPEDADLDLDLEVPEAKRRGRPPKQQALT